MINRKLKYLMLGFFAHTVSVTHGQDIDSIARNHSMLYLTSIQRMDSLKKAPIKVFSSKKANLFKVGNGTVKIGYDYGLLPYIFADLPSGMFTASGNSSFSLMGIPFQCSFFYSDLKSISGLNNYFRIHYDASHLQQLKKGLNEKRKAEYSQLLDNLGRIKQSSIRHLYYLSQKEQFLFLDSLNRIKGINYNLNLDTIQGISDDTLSTLYANQYSASHDKETLSDLRNRIEREKKFIDEISTRIEALQNEMGRLSEYKNSYENQLSSGFNVNRFFSGFRRFDVGLCYPEMGGLLMSNIPLKGIHTEWSSNKWFVSIANGRSINNLLFSNNLIQNNLSFSRNLFNYFDFQNVNSGRRISAIRIGYGNAHGDHISIGVAYTKGLLSYYESPIVNDNTNQSIERNFAFTLSARKSFLKNHTIGLEYGRTRLESENLPEQFGFSGIFRDLSQSFAAIGDYQITLPKWKGKIKVRGRWIHPFYRNYALGFLRPDHYRYEIRYDQQLGNRSKLSLFYRKEQDNLLSLFNYTNSLTSFGLQTQFRLSPKWIIRNTISPVVQNGKTVSDTLLSGKFSNYYIQNSSQYIFKNEFGKGSVLIHHSYYQLGTRENSMSFHTAGISTDYKTNSQFSIAGTIQYFQAPPSDSMIHESLLSSFELGGPVGKTARLTGGIKYSWFNPIGNPFGYVFRYQQQIAKNFSLQFSFEKVVTGDFYNSFPVNAVREYPFFSSMHIVINW